jgi:hypothetical protein
MVAHSRVADRNRPVAVQDLSKSCRRLIACPMVIDEISPFLSADVSVEVFDFGLHRRPDELRVALQAKIDQLSATADTLVLGYGLCGMAVVGLRACGAALVVPRVDDCIGLLLGSEAAYQQQLQSEPGTYFLTKSGIDAGATPFAEYELLADKWGREKARRMVGLVLKNYRRLAFIKGRELVPEHYRDYARRLAREFDLRYEEVTGSLAFTQKLVRGPWDEAFVVLGSGETLTLDRFRSSATRLPTGRISRER